MTDGRSFVARLDRDGNMITGAAPADPRRRIVTTKPGDWVILAGERYQVTKVQVFASMPIESAQASGHGPSFNPHMDQ